MRSFLTFSLVIVCCALMAGGAAAATATATLDPATIPGGVVCGQVWSEGVLDLSFVPQTADDCSGGGPCFFGGDPTGVWLFPARLEVKLNVAGVITAAEADVEDYCGANCSRLFLYDGGGVVDQDGNVGTVALETLSVSSGGAPVTHVAVSSCEALFSEIRITYEPPLPVEPTTWGAVKALFEE